MDQLIDTIRTAIASDASTEQKAAGVQACRTIIAALDTEPGKPLMSPASVAMPSRPTLDQMLDLVITRLTTIANAQEAATVAKKVSPAVTQLPASPTPPLVSALPRQVPASLSRGLRVPAAVAPPRPVARRTNASQIRQTSSAEFKTARFTPTKHPNAPTRKP